MISGESKASEIDLRYQREALRRGLIRTTAAAALIVLVVIVLAALALYAALRANRNAEDAQRASAAAETQLWNSYLAQARSSRLTGRVGARAESLTAVKAAAAIRPSAQLRREAIAAFALLDLGRPENKWPIPADATRVAVNPDLSSYALIDRHGALRLIDANDGREINSLVYTNDPFDQVIFNPEGTKLALRTQKQLLLWDPKRGEILRIPRGQNLAAPDLTLNFSADGGELLLSTGSGSIQWYEAATGRHVRASEIGINPLWEVASQPGGHLLAIRGGGNLVLWDVLRNQEFRRFAHSNNLNRVAWSPDGRLVAAPSEDNNTYVYDVDTFNRTEIRGHTREVVEAIFHPDGKLLATFAWDGTTRFWDPFLGKELLQAHYGRPVKFNREGNRLAFFQGNNLARASFVPSAELRRGDYPIGRGKWYHKQMKFTPDGRYMFAGDNLGIVVWDTASGDVVDQAHYGGEIQSIHLLPDGNTLFGSGWAGLCRVDLRREGPDQLGALRLSQPEWIALSLTGRVHGSALSANGKRLGVRVDDDMLVLEVPSMKPVMTVPMRSPIDPDLSPDGRFVAAGKGIWDIAEKRLVLDLTSKFRRGEGLRGAFSPDGRRVVFSSWREHHAYEVGTWRLLHTQPLAEGLSAAPLAFSADSKQLAAVMERGVIELLDPENYRSQGAFTVAEGLTATQVGLSPDGRYLAVATDLPVIQLWDLHATRQALSALGLDSRPRMPNESPSPARAGQPFSLAALSPYLWVGFGGVVGLVLLLGAVVMRHYYSLMQQYLRVDTLILERNQQLEVARVEIYNSQKMKALGTLAAGIAHDFNNLLSVIRMANKLTARESKENPEIQENIKLVEKAVAQGKAVVNSMLGYSREPSTAPESYSVADTVDNAVALLSKQFLGGIEVVLDLDRSAPLVSSSQGRLEQILLNLVVNASEAMAGRGRLLIAVRPSEGCANYVLRPTRAGRYIDLVIADSGPGISREIQDRIFEPFFTTKAAGAAHGTGLGLSMVYNLAQQDGIGISLETDPGRGTTFHILIPV